MKRELKLQTDIIKSVRKDGGYARKLSNRFQIGIPDLIISYPGFVPCFAEVKDFGAVPTNFYRAVGTTEKQRHELKLISGSQLECIAFILIGYQMQKKHYLLYVPCSTERVSSGLLQGVKAPVIARDVGQYYNMRVVLETMWVPRMRGDLLSLAHKQMQEMIAP